MTKRQSQMVLALTALLWSVGGLLIKNVSASGAEIAGLRSLIACGVFVLFAKSLGLDFRLSFIGWIAAIANALTILSFVIATKMGTAANAIFLQSTAPVYVLVIGFLFLRERIKFTDFMSIAMVIVGLSCFFFESIAADSLVPTAIGLFSGLCFGVFLTLMRRIQSQQISAIFWGNALCFVATIWFFKAATFTTNNLAVLAVLGVVQLALPYVLYARASRQVSAFDTSLIFLLEPLLNPLWVYIGLGEAPSGWAIIGAMIVLGTIAWRSFAEQKMQTT